MTVMDGLECRKKTIGAGYAKAVLGQGIAKKLSTCGSSSTINTLTLLTDSVISQPHIDHNGS